MMNAFRSLYKVWSKPQEDGGQVVAFITGENAQQVLQRYHTQGGQSVNPVVERISYGFPQDELEVFA